MMEPAEHAWKGQYSIIVKCLLRLDTSYTKISQSCQQRAQSQVWKTDQYTSLIQGTQCYENTVQGHPKQFGV